MRLDRDDLRRYARRDWGAPERLARRRRAAQPVARKIALAVELYEAARAASPSWPDEQCRADDLESHIKLRQLLRRANHVGSR